MEEEEVLPVKEERKKELIREDYTHLCRIGKGMDLIQRRIQWKYRKEPQGEETQITEETQTENKKNLEEEGRLDNVKEVQAEEPPQDKEELVDNEIKDDTQKGESKKQPTSPSPEDQLLSPSPDDQPAPPPESDQPASPPTPDQSLSTPADKQSTAPPVSDQPIAPSPAPDFNAESPLEKAPHQPTSSVTSPPFENDSLNGSENDMDDEIDSLHDFNPSENENKESSFESNLNDFRNLSNPSDELRNKIAREAMAALMEE